MADLFTKHCQTEEDDRFMASSCDVEVDQDGYFVSVVTDAHEGHAMFTLPCARQVYEALGEAIAIAEAHHGNQPVRKGRE